MTFYELEKECKKRRQNRILTLALLSFFTVTGVVVAVYYLYFHKKTEKVKEVKKIEKREIKQAEVKKVKKVEIKKVTEKKENNITKEKPKPKPVKKEVQTLAPIIELNVTEKKKYVKKEKSGGELKISKKRILDIENLPSYETCIKLAQKFYRLKDYENALKWAKNANLQNKSLPESWMLTAKSLYKLNKKEEAVKILTIYYHYTKNRAVLDLIKRIKNDKI